MIRFHLKHFVLWQDRINFIHEFEIASCLGRSRMLGVWVDVQGERYSAVVDCGATASYIPEKGRLVNKHHPLMKHSVTVSKTLFDNYQETSVKETTLDIKLSCDYRQKPITSRFICINGQDDAFGHDLLLGQPEIVSLDLRIKPTNEKLCILHQGKSIGVFCSNREPTNKEQVLLVSISYVNHSAD